MLWVIEPYILHKDIRYGLIIDLMSKPRRGVSCHAQTFVIDSIIMIRVLLAAAALFPLAASSWLDGDDSVDRPYGDMLKAPIRLFANDPPSQCAQLCLDTSDCVAWAYCKTAKCDPKIPLCYLKSTVTPQSWNDSIVRLNRACIFRVVVVAQWNCAGVL